MSGSRSPDRPRIDNAQRRARLGSRHHLARSARAASPVAVVRSLVALHATDAASVYLSAFARLSSPSVADIEHALYTDRALVRMLGMRRTMFVVPLELAPVVQAACTDAIAAQERRRTLQLLATAGITSEPSAWLVQVEEDTLDAISRRGEATAQELTQAVPALRTQFVAAEGKPYSAVQGIVTRILMQLSAEGHIVRGRPRGSWISSQYRWAPAAAWFTAYQPSCERSSAQKELIRAWLASFGPATLADIKWWTGLTMGEVKRAVAQLDVLDVALESGPGLVLTEDGADVPPPEPWVTLLPALDPTPMGYADRSWFLGPHAPALFDRSGNIGPTTWADGRIVGGWTQRKDGTVVHRLLEDVGAETGQMLDDAAERLGVWLGATRVTPRFRTPLERELSA